METGCPRIAEHLALQLIEEIEQFRVWVVGAALRAIRAQQEQDLPDPEAAIDNLVQAVTADQGVFS